jgi:hypothetical protein
MPAKRWNNSPTSLELLSEAQCEEVRQTVHALRNSWETLDSEAGHPFYKLGAASYELRRPDLPPVSYYAYARRMNPILLDKFGWLYERLSDVLAQHLERPIHYSPDLALPGFHIFLGYQSPKGRSKAIHYDENIKSVRFDGADEVDFDCTVSFTAAIALPKSGAGLNLWDVVGSAETTRLKIPERLASMPYQFHPYKIGNIFIHSGQHYHQIAHFENVGPTDERITLQGSAVLQGDKIVAFW